MPCLGFRVYDLLFVFKVQGSGFRLEFRFRVSFNINALLLQAMFMTMRRFVLMCALKFLVMFNSMSTDAVDAHVYARIYV